MVININSAIQLCGTKAHIYTVTTSTHNTGDKKKYYQHRHPGFEIHYILNGQCKVTSFGKSIYLDQDSMIMIPPGAYHDVVPTKESTTKVCISFNIQSKNAANIADSFAQIFDRNKPIVATLQDNEALHIFNRIYQLAESANNDIYRNDKILALCNCLLLELIPYLADSNSKAGTQHIVNEPEDINYKIDSFLGTNFMYNNAKSRIASDLYISSRQLQRIIQKNYGMSYRQKLAETRLQIAIDLLSNSDTPIHKISEILGYSCSANFSAFIKRTTGKTPSQIRKER